ncbi:hypothetical protein TIFTF001_028868 [Ficus carica]|uniref:GDSL esterase/lipase n=1 Tax=Ficus carica TaxID=3494 RepID=A0AA88DQU6_FICCA|nr:hypothetical protein TIFTF001_028868 [Ficus carica]
MLFVPSFCLLCFVHSSPFAYGQTDLVPAFFMFGDSTFDVENNNEPSTVIKANFPPYRRDYFNQKPTGRSSNGKLATDFIADGFNFSSPQPAYHSGGRNLLIGANFASAGSGHHDATTNLFNAIPITKQLLENYKEYKGRVIEIVGEENATSLFSRGIHLDLYQLGARRIGVKTSPPIGCLPAVITLFRLGNNECVETLNHDTIAFNRRLNFTSEQLKIMLTDLKLVVFDVYQTLYGLITRPGESSFTEIGHSCCGTSLVEISILCNASLSLGTCSNATEYVFWDAFHPSEVANKHIYS